MCPPSYASMLGSCDNYSTPTPIANAMLEASAYDVLSSKPVTRDQAGRRTCLPGVCLLRVCAYALHVLLYACVCVCTCVCACVRVFVCMCVQH